MPAPRAPEANPPSSYSWVLYACDYSGSYDPQLYPERILENTRRLVTFENFDLQTSGTVWSREQLTAISVDALDEEYNRLKAELETLELVESSAWEAIRQEGLRELENVYRLTRVTLQAYSNPTELRNYPGADRCKAEYAEPLIAGGERVLEAWKVLNEASRVNNGDPASVKQRFDDEYASAERLEYALLELMAHGWWNCANDELDRTLGERVDQRHAEFQKLFIQMNKPVCEE